jgi:hypothetical protein
VARVTSWGARVVRVALRGWLCGGLRWWWAVVFAMSNQWTRTMIAGWSWHRDAFLTRTQLWGDSVAGISFASILRAWTLITRLLLGDTPLARTTRIVTTGWFGAGAVQAWTRTTVWTIGPFVLASWWGFRKSEFGARRCSFAAILAIFEAREIVVIASTARVIEGDALATRGIVGPSTNVLVASTVIDTLTTALVPITPVPVSPVSRGQRAHQSSQTNQNEDLHLRS